LSNGFVSVAVVIYKLKDTWNNFSSENVRSSEYPECNHCKSAISSLPNSDISH